MAFLEYPANVSDLLVNHIDGIKENNDLGNLEWVTARENILHAVATGLRSDNTPILIRNVLTGEVTEAFSIAEAGRLLNVSRTVILQRLNKVGQPLWPGGIQFKLSSDKDPWRDPNDVFDELKSMKAPSPIKALNVFTGEESFHVDASSAGMHTGVNEATVKWRLNKAKVEIPVNGYLFRYTWDDKTWPVYTSFQLECFKVSPKDPPSPVLCTDLTTQTDTLYVSVDSVSLALGINPNTIKTCIRSTRPFSKRYTFMYVDLLTLDPIPRN